MSTLGFEEEWRKKMATIENPIQFAENLAEEMDNGACLARSCRSRKCKLMINGASDKIIISCDKVLKIKPNMGKTQKRRKQRLKSIVAEFADYLVVLKISNSFYLLVVEIKDDTPTLRKIESQLQGGVKMAEILFPPSLGLKMVPISVSNGIDKGDRIDLRRYRKTLKLHKIQAEIKIENCGLTINKKYFAD